MSEAPHVLIAMNEVMAAIGKTGIAKDRKNQQQGYAFRGIDDVYNELNSIMAEAKLLMIPVKMIATRSERPTKQGGSLFFTQLTVTWELASAVDGSRCAAETVGEAMDSADKSSSKAQSAAMKYAAMMVFMIPTEGDNDADATTHEVASFPADRPPPQETRPRQSANQARKDGDWDRGIAEMNRQRNVDELMRWAKAFGPIYHRWPKPWKEEFDALYRAAKARLQNPPAQQQARPPQDDDAAWRREEERMQHDYDQTVGYR
jgi:hypothetical protein